MTKEEFIKYNGYKYMTIRYSNIEDSAFKSTHNEIISNALLLEQWCELLPSYNDKLNEYINVPHIAPQNTRAENNCINFSPFLIPFQFFRICIKK